MPELKPNFSADILKEFAKYEVSMDEFKNVLVQRKFPPKEEEMTTARELMKGFKIGADPEFFIVDENGRPVSAAGLIPGTKAEPFPVSGGAIQVDGMAAEVNINPVSNFEDFNNNLNLVIGAVKSRLPKGYKPLFQPTVTFDKDVFDAAPADAKELGCTPDTDAWSGNVNPPPGLMDRPTLRCAGGHIHIGWTENADVTDPEHISHCRDLVKQLDWFLGGWSATKDLDTDRRLLYGKIGACRYKPYGVEYRVLSNFWLADKTTRLMVWNRCCAALDAMKSIYLPNRASPRTHSWLVEAVNTGKVRDELKKVGQYPLSVLDSNYLRM